MGKRSENCKMIVIDADEELKKEKENFPQQKDSVQSDKGILPLWSFVSLP